jgi:hypothetical protein
MGPPLSRPAHPRPRPRARPLSCAQGTQRHFANVATLVGNRYMVHDSKGSSIADVPGLASRVRQAMDWVAEAYSGKPTFTPPSSSWRQKNPDEEAFDDMLGGNNKDDIFSGTDFF